MLLQSKHLTTPAFLGSWLQVPKGQLERNHMVGSGSQMLLNVRITKELVLIVHIWALLTKILVHMPGVGPSVCTVVKHITLWETPSENLCLQDHLTLLLIDSGQWLEWRWTSAFSGSFLPQTIMFWSEFDLWWASRDHICRVGQPSGLGKVSRHLGQCTFFPAWPCTANPQATEPS